MKRTPALTALASTVTGIVAATTLSLITASPAGAVFPLQVTGRASVLPGAVEPALRGDSTDPAISGPFGLTVGSDGNLWFTSFAGGSIGRITPTGVVTTFTDPSVNGPRSITSGPDGNLWFTSYGANTIERLTPTGQFTAWPLPPGITGPTAIAAGTDGGVWFTAANAVGRIQAV